MLVIEYLFIKDLPSFIVTSFRKASRTRVWITQRQSVLYKENLPRRGGGKLYGRIIYKKLLEFKGGTRTLCDSRCALSVSPPVHRFSRHPNYMSNSLLSASIKAQDAELQEGKPL
jgi:hypothetical protein